MSVKKCLIISLNVHIMFNFCDFRRFLILIFAENFVKEKYLLYLVHIRIGYLYGSDLWFSQRRDLRYIMNIRLHFYDGFSILLVV
jgi:hypothetical protein